MLSNTYTPNKNQINISLKADKQVIHLLCIYLHKEISLQTYSCINRNIDDLKTLIQQYQPVYPQQNIQDLETILNKLINKQGMIQQKAIQLFFKGKLKPHYMNTIDQPKNKKNLEFSNIQLLNQVCRQRKKDLQQLQKNPSLILDISLENKYIQLFLQTLGYKSISKLGKGAFKVVFKALPQDRDHFVAVKVFKNKNINQSKIATRVKQECAKLLVGNFLQVHRSINSYGLNIVQQQLAKNTLKDIINQKRDKNQKFSRQQIYCIIKDLVQNLYHIHMVGSCVHRDIKPENIFLYNGRYSFGDYGEAEEVNFNIFDNALNVDLTQIRGTPVYMDPILLGAYNDSQLQKPQNADIYEFIRESINSNNSKGTIKKTQRKRTLPKTSTISIDRRIDKKYNYTYNPFKSDIYSLGLVFFEILLHNKGYFLDQQIHYLFYYKRNQPQFKKLITQCEKQLEEPLFILFNDQLLERPSFFTKMLEYKFEQRISTFQLTIFICKQTLIQSLTTPFIDIFQPIIIQLKNDKNQLSSGSNNDDSVFLNNKDYLVKYNYKSMYYKGNYVLNSNERQGAGTMYQKMNEWKKSMNIIYQQQNQYLSQSQYQQNQNQKIQEFVEGKEKGKVIYDGYWKNNLPNGEGKLYLNHHDNIFQGHFLNGQFHGNGALKYKDSHVQNFDWKKNYNRDMLKKPTSINYGIIMFQVVAENPLTIFGRFSQNQQNTERRKLQVILDYEKMGKQILNLIGEMLRYFDYKIKKISYQENKIFKSVVFLFESQKQNKLQFKIRKGASMINQIIIRAFVSINLNIKYLQYLQIPYGDFQDETIEYLIKGNIIIQFKQINLKSNYTLGQTVINRLLNCQISLSLIKINLSETQISNSTINIIINSKGFKNIRQIQLQRCFCLTQIAISALIVSQKVSNLILLNLNYNNFKGFQIYTSLAVSTYIKELKYLYTKGFKMITIQSLQAFFKSKNSNQLICLQLQHCQILKKSLNSLNILGLVIQNCPEKLFKLNLQAINHFTLQHIHTFIEEWIDTKNQKIRINLSKSCQQNYQLKKYRKKFKDLLKQSNSIEQLIVTVTEFNIQHQINLIQLFKKESQLKIYQIRIDQHNYQYFNLLKAEINQLHTLSIEPSSNVNIIKQIQFYKQKKKIEQIHIIDKNKSLFDVMLTKKWQNLVSQIQKQKKVMQSYLQQIWKYPMLNTLQCIKSNCTLLVKCVIGINRKIQQLIYLNKIKCQKIFINNHLNYNNIIIDHQKEKQISVTYDNNLARIQSIDQTLHALSASKSLENLTSLNLSKRYDLTQAGLGFIFNSKYSRNIKYLNISQTRVTSKCLLMLAKCSCVKLYRIEMNRINRMQLQDIKSFLQSKIVSQLKLDQFDLYVCMSKIGSIEQLNLNFEQQNKITRKMNKNSYQKNEFKSINLRKVYINLNKQFFIIELNYIRIILNCFHVYLLLF